MADGFVEVTRESLQTPEGIVELNRMLDTLFRYLAGDANDVKVIHGYGAPTMAAGDGSLYLRKDGGAGTTLYCMEAGTWTAK